MRLCAALLVQPLIGLLSCLRKTSSQRSQLQRFWCEDVPERSSVRRRLPNGQFYVAFCGRAGFLVSHMPLAPGARTLLGAFEPCDAKEDKVALLCIAYSPREAS